MEADPIRYEDFNIPEGVKRRTYRVDADGTIFCDRTGCVGSQGLRDHRTNVPICRKCAVKTPVGYVSEDTARAQRKTYFNASSVDYAIAAGTAFFISLVAGFFVVGFLGFWLFVVFLSFPVGGAIGEAVWRALRGKRGEYMQYAVGIGIITAGILLLLFTSNLFGVLIYTFISISSATARFQLGLRV